MPSGKRLKAIKIRQPLPDGTTSGAHTIPQTAPTPPHRRLHSPAPAKAANIHNDNTTTTHNAMKKDTTDKVTIANIVSITGIALLAVLTYIGHSYKSLGQTGWDIVSAAATAAIAAFILWLAVKAKGAETDISKWRKLEYAALAAYAIFAVASASVSGTMHFFAANTSRAQLKALARQDIQTVDSMLADYETFQKQAISNTAQGLGNSLNPGNTRTGRLQQYIDDNNITPTRRGADDYKAKKTDQLVGRNSAYNGLKEEYRRIQTTFGAAVESSRLMHMARDARQISEFARQAEEALTQASASANLPAIYRVEGTSAYTTGDPQTRQYSVSERLKFAAALSQGGFSIAGAAALILIHALVLFNYFFAHRTSKVGVRTETDADGGILLG